MHNTDVHNHTNNAVLRCVREFHPSNFQIIGPHCCNLVERIIRKRLFRNYSIRRCNQIGPVSTLTCFLMIQSRLSVYSTRSTTVIVLLNVLSYAVPPSCAPWFISCVNLHWGIIISRILHI